MLRVTQNMTPWPENWPLYKQPCFGSWDDACDMLVGPCRCGASHQEGEFEYRDGWLYRYGKKVDALYDSEDDDELIISIVKILDEADRSERIMRRIKIAVYLFLAVCFAAAYVIPWVL